ncbi:BLUF domain protein [Methylobacterium sp. 4-46]|uniref:BLUF domain-containing protein n=1 Tax=unclassified Methylobacterium TaxID=2615210 RepID=UPI000165CE20|nr:MULTISPECIES: BLUF domain-containing protein [Methylobacterium]ACA18917.1 BLUF domain protein [Methylobacterium sp. 4-46]WFT78139.1 BLUF domain-containing protein [Methylobacterium nodulans]
MLLHRLLYRSEAALPGRAARLDRELDGIIAASRARNEAAGLTGALLHVPGIFVQALEGPLPAIEATFERICCDLRHRRVELLELAPTDERLFGSWSMTRIAVDRPDLLPAALLLPEARGDGASARATIRLMRALLVGGAAAPADESAAGAGGPAPRPRGLAG